MKLWIGLAGLAALVAAASAQAVSVTGTGMLFGPAFQPDIGDEVLVMVSNEGRRPVAAEILVLRAADHAVLSTTDVTVMPRTTASASHFIDEDVLLLVAVRYRAPGRTLLRVSMQVLSPTGDTRIFTDGFESGDVSA